MDPVRPVQTPPLNEAAVDEVASHSWLSVPVMKLTTPAIWPPGSAATDRAVLGLSKQPWRVAAVVTTPEVVLSPDFLHAWKTRPITCMSASIWVIILRWQRHSPTLGLHGAR